MGIATRTIGFGVAAVGVVRSGAWTDASPSDLTNGLLLLLLGGTIITVSAVADVVTVPSDVQRRNDDWLRAHAILGARRLPDGRTPALAFTVTF